MSQRRSAGPPLRPDAVLSHLANPWILARLVLGLAAVALALTAAAGAAGVLLAYRAAGAADERTLALERRSELVATAMSAAFALEISAAALTVLASDRLAGAIRGAMCAYGVFGSSPWGPRALGSAFAAAAGCAAWLAARTVDARLRRGSLARALSGAALAVTALVCWDFFSSARYLLGLDLNVVATCCSVFVDASRGGAVGGAVGAGALRELALGGVLAAGAGVAGAALWRRPSGSRGAMAGALGAAGALAGLRAAAHAVAPYVYETPNHPCGYCLLHADALPAGPAVIFALCAGLLLAAGALAVVPLLRREGARRAGLEVLGSIGRWSAVAWGLALVAGAYPVLRYGALTGTFSLFR